jgi:hypothetical protein
VEQRAPDHARNVARLPWAATPRPVVTPKAKVARVAGGESEPKEF